MLPDLPGGATSDEARSPRFRLLTLKARRDFVAAQSGPRFVCPAFTMLRRLPRPGEAPREGVRFGFTVTKKLGSAVLRNRIRRRLRAAAGEAAAQLPGTPLDLVIIARGPALEAAFAGLVADIARAASVLARRDRPAKPRQPG